MYVIYTYIHIHIYGDPLISTNHRCRKQETFETWLPWHFWQVHSSWQLHKAGNRMLIFQFAKCLDKLTYIVVKTIINHPIFDGLYHPFMVLLGMVYYCFNHIKSLMYNMVSHICPLIFRWKTSIYSRGFPRTLCLITRGYRMGPSDVNVGLDSPHEYYSYLVRYI